MTEERINKKLRIMKKFFCNPAHKLINKDASSSSFIEAKKEGKLKGLAYQIPNFRTEKKLLISN